MLPSAFIRVHPWFKSLPLFILFLLAAPHIPANAADGAESVSPRMCALAEIQSEVLKPEDALLVYSLGETSSRMFLIRRGSVKTYVLPPAEKTAIKILAFRKNLTRENSWRNVLEMLARELYNTLLGPADAELKDVQRLIIVPDGALHFLPFEALMTLKNEEDVYAVEKFGIRYSPDVSLLCPSKKKHRESAQAPENYKEWTGFGATGYDGPGGIPGSELEIDAVSKIFNPDNREVNPLSGAGIEKRTLSKLLNIEVGGNAVNLGADATERALKSAIAAGGRYFHISARCVSASDAPGRVPALILSPGGAGDSFFTEGEILETNIRAEMVALTACINTDEARIEHATAVFGIPLAFLRAGAESLVLSLWDGRGEERRDLIVKFYRALRDGAAGDADVEAALQKVKLEMIARGRHPSDWAGLIFMSGD